MTNCQISQVANIVVLACSRTNGSAALLVFEISGIACFLLRRIVLWVRFLDDRTSRMLRRETILGWLWRLVESLDRQFRGACCYSFNRWSRHCANRALYSYWMTRSNPFLLFFVKLKVGIIFFRWAYRLRNFIEDSCSYRLSIGGRHLLVTKLIFGFVHDWNQFTTAWVLSEVILVANVHLMVWTISTSIKLWKIFVFDNVYLRWLFVDSFSRCSRFLWRGGFVTPWCAGC